MTFYIIQHGKANSEAIDPTKGLSQDGITDVQRIAEVANAYHITVDKIIHSGKKRARETAEIMSGVLEPKKGISIANGISAKDDARVFAKSVSDQENLMVVSHMPFVQKLLSILVTGQADIPLFDIQNGGIIALHQPEHTNRWIIKWALMPSVK